MPATFTGGNTDGTSVVPAVFNDGDTEPADFNGFFLIQSDTGVLESNALADGDTCCLCIQVRDVPLWLYHPVVSPVDLTTIHATCQAS